MRYYIYSLKRLYRAVDYIYKYYLKFIQLQYKLFTSLISLKKKNIKKNIFFFIFFFNNEKIKYLKKFIVNRIYKQIFFLKNFDIYKKKYFNFFFFNLNKKIDSKYYFFLRKKISLLNIFIKMRFFFNLDNFFFLFIVQCLII
jgi:hypothetical protein